MTLDDPDAIYTVPELKPSPVWLEVTCGGDMLRRFCCSHCCFETMDVLTVNSDKCPNCGLTVKEVIQNGRFN